MQVKAKAFWVPKAGNSEAEYEDAFCPVDSGQFGLSTRFAVADGATQTSFSRFWAQLLAQAYCEAEISENDIRDKLRPLQERWRLEIGSKPLPWFAQEKIRQGAFSTLVGIEFAESQGTEGIWKAVAVGDSCLFQVRAESTLLAFPLSKSEDFGNSPALLSSNDASNHGIEDSVVCREGEWQEGDSFLLMTDAAACWFFWSIEHDINPMEALGKITNQDEFMDFVEVKRSLVDENGRKIIRNDDMTVLWIEMG